MRGSKERTGDGAQRSVQAAAPRRTAPPSLLRRCSSVMVPTTPCMCLCNWLFQNQPSTSAAARLLLSSLLSGLLSARGQDGLLQKTLQLNGPEEQEGARPVRGPRQQRQNDHHLTPQAEKGASLRRRTPAKLPSARASARARPRPSSSVLIPAAVVPLHAAGRGAGHRANGGLHRRGV